MSLIGKKNHGFSLLELMVVLAIIAIASAIIIPSISNESLFFRTQIRELIAVLKYNRRMAILENKHQEVKILPSIADNNFTKQQDKVKKTKKNSWQSDGISYTWRNNSLQQQSNTPVSIYFFPQGGASSGQLKLSLNHLTASIDIDGFTGKVTLKD